MCTCLLVAYQLSIDLSFAYLVQINSFAGLTNMLRKPFRTPFLKKPENLSESDDHDSFESHPKRRRISYENEPTETNKLPQLIFKVPGISSLPRKPLSKVENSVVFAEPRPLDSQGANIYYNVLW